MTFPVVVTPLYVALCGLLIFALAALVVRLRLKYRVGIGAGGHAELDRMIRVHANAVEYVPISLLLIFCLEAVGAAWWVIHLLGCTLFLSRLLHALGLGAFAGVSKPRQLGILLNWMVMVGASILILWKLLLP